MAKSSPCAGPGGRVLRDATGERRNRRFRQRFRGFRLCRPIPNAESGLKLSSRIAGVRQFANNLVLLGLIGTVVGFIMALSGVDPDTVGDAAAIAPMVSNLIEGMGVALYTTLVGSVLNIWLMLNCRLLETASVSLVTQLVELAEGPGRA
jgi:MotA/TolQ/ExbB proton channel family